MMAIKLKKVKKQRKPSTSHKREVTYVAFGPAGLKPQEFAVHKQQLLEDEEPVKKVPEHKKEPQIEVKRDVYSKTDSEVNIKITNLDILQKIKAKNDLFDKNTKKNNTATKAETLSAMTNKLRYLEDKISKINDSMSSTSDKSSSVIDVDSDNESVTALEIKLGLNKTKVKKPVESEPLNFVEDIKPHVNPFKNLDGSVSIFVDKLVSPVLMVHTKKNNRIQTVNNMRDIPFGKDIHVALRNMSVNEPMRPQTVSWSTVLRGHSLFLIGPFNSGKSMGYLPAVSRLVNDYKNSTQPILGLSTIILCATSHSVASVESACKMFLHGAKIFACYAGIDDLKITTALLNGCDLLICTPTLLVRLIREDFSLDLRSLSTFVIDDCEHMSQVYPNELKFCLLKVRDVVKARANKEWKVQYIVVSRIWCDFMLSLARKAPDSVICISAFEECVLYSKVATSVEFLVREKKLDSVIQFLKDTDRSKKTVIVCRSDDEVDILEKTLTKLKYVTFACNSSMTIHNLYKLGKSLNEYVEPVSGPILICCDGNLAHLNVTDAFYLVHYSLPALFSTFCKRFSVLNDNYPSIFVDEESPLKIKILLDDTNIEQLPKILHFIKRCSNDIPPLLDEISTSVLSEKDLKKAQNLVSICRNLLSLGKCPDFWNCSDRHAVFKDFDEPKAWVPRDGTITFQILHYHSAVYYSARITSCITKSTTTKYPQTYSLLSIKMGMYYSKESNRRLHGTPVVGDICAVTLKQNLFMRCQVTRILQTTAHGQPNLVRIKLIDEERYETTKDVQLYHLPDDLKNIETHVVTVIMANLMPQDKDVTFSKLARNKLKRITDENEDVYLRGQINLVIGNHVFVNTVEVCQDLSSLDEIVVKNDFRKELLDGHALDNPNHIVTLKKLCYNTPCEDKEQELAVEVPKPIKTLPKGRWAHLESDTFSSVFFMSAENPCKFFVRPIKFEKCLTTLIKDIQKYVADDPEPLEGVNVGDIVLAEFPDDATYERARIDKIIDENKVSCFFVDQADWRVTPINKLKPITEQFINLLPFQAIECKLIGIQPVGDAWSDFSTNFFADNCYDSVDKLKHLYTKYFTKEKAEFTDGHKYGVVLVDTYSENEDVIINQVLIDKNLAEETDEIHYLNDIQFKRESSKDTDTESDVESDLAKPLFDDKDNFQLVKKLPNHILRSVPLVDSDDSLDSFDFVTDSFGNLGSVPISEVVALKEIPENVNKIDTSTVTPIEKVIKPNDESKNSLVTENLVAQHYGQFSKPKLLWRQNSNTVTVKIKLIVDEYDIKIQERHITFSAEANDTKYAFDFELYGVIDPKRSNHSNKGQYIQVKLWKVMARNWLTLTRENGVNKWIVYDVESIDVSSGDESDDDDQNKVRHINTFLDSDSDDNLQDDISFSYKRE
ncbi:putative ATP-dependent RNA helicase TDRD12 isoform X2 [Trichoplusia ni]|uniref:RNA helicase n=1 Tax=Trichoplusia ni TaxID=7111 RepID=A0A7E5WMV9_TRINI|nr:putative ATP-dependent RNA helicase TDRD12 isoform X2 [Trichoplusia ni]